MKKLASVTIAVLCIACLVSGAAVAKEKDKGETRQKLDDMAQEAIDELFEQSSHARELYDAAYGYAVFDNLKVAFVLSGGGGQGVAVAKGSGDRTYMKMGTGGVGLGIGGQKYQVIFLFETETAFDKFVSEGWSADTQAHAAAGTAGAGVASTFRNGIAIYQITEKGLIASADVSGTKYWKNKKLN